ncbi:MAG: flagellar hook-associated protein FlgK, partial [Litorimonas sp.]
MSLTAGLSTARSGLALSGARAQVASENIANVSTPGYVRRDAVAVTLSNGVTVGQIARAQDAGLVQARRDAQSQSAGSGLIDTALTRTLSAFGDPGSETGMFGSLSRFEGDLQTLRSTPESASAQSIAVDSLKDLVREISTAAAALQSERTSADAQIATDVEQVNGLAQNLYDLNSDIRKADAAQSSTAELLDQRDRLIDQINERLPVTVSYEDNGAVQVGTRTGLVLVGKTVNRIEFQPSNLIGAVDTTTTNGGRLSVPTLHGQPIAPGSGVHGVSGGRIGANLDLRDNQIPQQAASLDQFTFELASAFDTAGEPLLLDSGAPVDALNKTGLAERIGVNALIDPSVGGQPSRLRDGLLAATPG